jgi:hypothetical protein
MNPKPCTLLAIALTTMCSTLSAGAAVDKLARVKAGSARETPRQDVAEPIDGLQGATAAELKTYCGSLKKERAEVEKELGERIMAARVAEGTAIDPKQLPSKAEVDIRKLPKVKDPKVAANTAEARATKQAVAEAFVRKATLTCLLYATRELQDGRAKKKVPATKELVKRCNDGKDVPELSALDCEEDKATEPKKETK